MAFELALLDPLPPEPLASFVGSAEADALEEEVSVDDASRLGGCAFEVFTETPFASFAPVSPNPKSTKLRSPLAPSVGAPPLDELAELPPEGVDALV
ncbi:MAG: hypothetical protein HRT56_01950, partial [Coraliomargarita sp.]|nr:hypothetical protein [Coraliomargarita sp.]